MGERGGESRGQSKRSLNKLGLSCAKLRSACQFSYIVLTDFDLCKLLELFEKVSNCR